jgi:hypothetical protein
MIDWRLPENRREAFQRFYSFHLKYKSHPGMVYSFLPAIAEAYDLDDDGRAWLAWLNGNTQNPAMSLLLLEAAPHPGEWQKAIDFWNDNFKLMDFDTDRRHQKGKFGVATEQWAMKFGLVPSWDWKREGAIGWQGAWKHSLSQPYMGRLSAWSMMEYARILLGPDVVPDMGSWLLEDKSGSRSHRNGIAVVAGYDATYWEADVPDTLGIVEDLDNFATLLLQEAEDRNPSHPDVGRLTMESALCTYKGWHKPNRRYPNVYADMAYLRLKKAEARFGKGRFDILWEARRRDLPMRLRLEDNPSDPGLVAVKQNHYLETGQVPMMSQEYLDMTSMFDHNVDIAAYGIRKDPKW